MTTFEKRWVAHYDRGVARTIVAAPDGSVAAAPFENPALASGGTGDVLAGTIGALLAQPVERSPVYSPVISFPATMPSEGQVNSTHTPRLSLGAPENNSAHSDS